MKFAFAAALSLLITLCHGTPVQNLYTRQGPGSYYAITGPTGGVHPRLEIRELQKTGEMWNLFLLAMTEFEAMDQKEIDSYYQIAGIHGMPWYDWDGVPQNPNIRKPVERGYCPHAQLLFAIWHRPYMLIFEQKLQAIAINIADRWQGSDKAKYQDAAQKLRLPYWDWARAIPNGEPVFPAVVASERVDVTGEDGQKKSIDNPLFDYDFHPLDNKEINSTGCRNAGGPLDGHGKMCQEGKRTVRKATVATRDASNHTELEKRFQQLLHPIRTELFKVMSHWQPFDSFANNGRCGDPDSTTALESSHDTIHVQMAPAHMVPVAVSAFDPVFWLHHANVDRYVAIWQAIYKDTYMQECRAETETWTIAVNDTLNVNSPLTPFHKNAQGDFWTPANSRNVEDMGYTYPELLNNPSNETLVAKVISLYGGPDDGSAPTKSKRQSSTVELDQAYLAEVEMPKLGQPYSLYVFLGDVDNNAGEWLGLDSFAGLTSTLGVMTDDVQKASVDVTEAIVKEIEGGKTKEEDAVEYLKKNLKWRVAFADAEIPRPDLPGAKVSLVSTEVKRSNSDSEFDLWVGGFKNHGEIDL